MRPPRGRGATEFWREFFTILPKSIENTVLEGITAGALDIVDFE